jgi:hypothetical protein
MKGSSCSYDGHREVSHPMCEGDFNYTCEGYAKSFDLQPRFGHLSRVEGRGLLEKQDRGAIK